MSVPDRTVTTPVDISMFSIGDDNETMVDYMGHLKSMKLKEEVAEYRVDGICDAAEDVEPGKGKWSIDIGHHATLAGIILRPGLEYLVQVRSAAEGSGWEREGRVIVTSREDDSGSDSDSQGLALTLRGKGELLDVVTEPVA